MCSIPTSLAVSRHLQAAVPHTAKHGQTPCSRGRVLAALALKIAINRRTIAGAARAGRILSKVGMTPHALSSGALRTVSRLDDDERREAFLATLRSVVGVRGQRVSALDKLHLLDGNRVLIIWGEDDPMIPMAHGAHAHSLLEGSRFVSFPDARHEPHVDDPPRFAALLLEHVID